MIVEMLVQFGLHKKHNKVEEPDDERVLAEAIVDMAIKPSYILKISEIRLVESEINISKNASYRT
ncbi:MAG: hypothetical protein IMZ62_01805 [Chloroflexi bacterium]|nr:hypothetical protein [Chloroflexota bacterium]